VHTPDPPIEQLCDPAITARLFCTANYATNYYDYWSALSNTNGNLWRYSHHLPIKAWDSNQIQEMNSELIPYTNSP
ncbi:MAG: hypothetical protein ACREDS_14910, partial [Limisphaerales bacterium]